MHALLRTTAVVTTGLLGLLALLLLGGLIGGTAVAAALNRDLPPFDALVQAGEANAAAPETTQIFAWGDAAPDGTREQVLIYEIADPLGTDRRWIPLAELPPHLVEATIASTNPTFWDDTAYGWTDVWRALLTVGQQEEFAPTEAAITAQLVNDQLLAPGQRAGNGSSGLGAYRRKLAEQLLVRQVSNAYTKEQILEWYLNSSFYGNLATGIEAAARVYFDKPAAALTLAEAAMLAPLPVNPARNPIDNPAAAKTLQEQTLDRMAAAGFVTAETAVSAKLLPTPVVVNVANQVNIIAPHFARAVQAELERLFGAQLVLGGGLRVTTTLDLTWQQQAECVARAHVNRLSGAVGAPLPADALARCAALDYLPPLPAAAAGIDQNVDNAAVVMLDPRTAQVKALVGSLNALDAQPDASLNMALDGLRQPGSAFYPFAALTALSQGYNPATMVLDVETDFGAISGGAPFVPQNADGVFHGPLRLREALGSGYTVPAVQVMSWMGVHKVIDAAHSMGITSMVEQSFGLDLALGGGEVSLLDMTYAYAVMDNMGTMIGQPRPESLQQSGLRTLDPILILRVEDAAGRVLYDNAQPQQRDILTPQLAFLMNDMLADRSARCAGFDCPNVLELPENRPAAVKTGTTADFRDAWTIGYTPQLVTGVWVGNTDNDPMQDMTGIEGAAPIWHALMAWSLQDAPLQTWERPSGIIELSVCEISGLLPTPICPTVSELFIQGTEPTLTDTMVQAFDVNRETGRLATVYTPPELVETRTYVIYPEAAAAWARANEMPQPPTEYDTIVTQPGDGGETAVSHPPDFAIVNGLVPITGTAQADNFAFYRLAYFQGLQPQDIQSIVDNVTEPQTSGLLGTWDTRELEGLYTLLLTVVGNDGSFTEVTTHVTVDNTPPTAELVFPQPDEQIFTDEERVVVQAEAQDTVALARVEFYVDDAGVPFAISSAPPFTGSWPIPGPGCHMFRALPVDAAGNEGEETAVSVCFIPRD